MNKPISYFLPSSEPDQNLIKKVSRCLESTNELARLTAYIPARLYELNWSDRVMELCQEFIRNYRSNLKGQTSIIDPIDIPLDEIVQAVTPQAKLLFPEVLLKQLEDFIVQFIGEQLID